MLKGFQKPDYGWRDITVDVDDVLLLKSLGIRCDPGDIEDCQLVLAAYNWDIQNMHYDFRECRGCSAHLPEAFAGDSARMQTTAHPAHRGS